MASGLTASSPRVSNPVQVRPPGLVGEAAVSGTLRGTMSDAPELLGGPVWFLGDFFLESVLLECVELVIF